MSKLRHEDREEQVSGGEQPLSRLDALRFARRVVEEQAERQAVVRSGGRSGRSG
ncbi:hypothetical protein [Streptomyces sp. NPDC051132]|uniref:hypothetical protein n=1 Tax=unclassified Streptomyces TaxID=2593676 RepID=UPI003416AC3D